MVDFIKRNKKDIFGWPIIGLFFKNRYLILAIRLLVVAALFSAIYFGFVYPTKAENPYTTALFWSLFWPFFMVITLPTLGTVFCGICPHGFIGKYLNKYGLKKSMPEWMKNPYISLSILLSSYWLMVYAFPQVLKTPYVSALFFLVLTLISFILFFLYKDMSYCKYICPIGPLTKAFGKVGFGWLSTYESACSSCKTFECATACPYHLQPFKFDNKNSMGDCTLCMDCAPACEAVRFEVRKPSSSLFSRLKKPKSIDIWVYILLLGSATIAMRFHHSLGRTAIADEMPWSIVGHSLENIFSKGVVDWVGLTAYMMALFSAITLSVGGLWLGSKILKIPFKEGFVLLGYGLAPLMILGALHHVLSFFFYHYASDLGTAYFWIMGSGDIVEPLASRRDGWTHLFSFISYIAVLWSLWIMAARVKLTQASTAQKFAAWAVSSSVVLFYLFLLIFTSYVYATYGAAPMHH